MDDENTNIHEVRVYEGSTDEHGNTVLGKLKRVITPKELQKLMNKKYTELNKYFKKKGYLSANITERECSVCGTMYRPRKNHGVVCSDKCRRVRSKERAKSGDGQYVQTGLHVKKGRPYL